MALAERLAEYVRACFTGIWIESHEHPDALAEIAELCRREGWRLTTWDVASGLEIAGRTAEGSKRPVKRSFKMALGMVMLSRTAGRRTRGGLGCDGMRSSSGAGGRWWPSRRRRG